MVVWQEGLGNPPPWYRFLYAYYTWQFSMHYHRGKHERRDQSRPSSAGR